MKKKRRKKSRRGLGSVGVARETFWEGRRLLEEAKHVRCPLRMELASRARGNALLSVKRFGSVRDTQSADASKRLAEQAMKVASTCLKR